ncbi:MAG: hypothetical protein R3E79_53610 [Caldilineaceae bacterium]
MMKFAPCHDFSSGALAAVCERMYQHAAVNLLAGGLAKAIGLDRGGAVG